MTPDEVATLAKNQYNAVGDTFYSDDELRSYLTTASKKIAAKSFCIKNIFETTTVVSQAEYALPTNIITIKRITYDGKKLDPITFREDDAATLRNSDSTETGEPSYYTRFDTSIFLRSIPSEAKTLKIYSICRAQAITAATATLEVPEDYHEDLAVYLNWRMAMKDENWLAAREFKKEWDSAVIEARMLERRKLRGDSFTSVQAMESLVSTTMGTV